MTLLVALLSLFTVLWPLDKIGGEFLPEINEGDLLYMPSTLPGVSAAQPPVQRLDELIKTIPKWQRYLVKQAGQKRLQTEHQWR